MDPSEIFFELANAPAIAFKVDNDTKNDASSIVSNRNRNDDDVSTMNMNNIKNSRDCINMSSAVFIRQDNTCQSHTGGIVWGKK